MIFARIVTAVDLIAIPLLIALAVYRSQWWQRRRRDRMRRATEIRLPRDN